MYKCAHALVVSILLLTPALVVGQTVTAPGAGANAVAAAKDFATTAFQDPWDMNQRTDLGWFLNGTDQPEPSLSNVLFSNGVFSATSTSNDPILFVVETGYGGTAPIGKIGTNFPVNADTYKLYAMRMRVNTPSAMQFFWTTNTIHDPPGSGLGTEPTQTLTSAGWRIYMVDLSTLTFVQGSGAPWTGTKRSLRLDPSSVSNESIAIDWIRLVQPDRAHQRTIIWTGGQTVDIYLDNDKTPTSDPALTLGLLAQGVTSPYTFNAGALAPGDYHVAMRPTGGTGNFAYSPGFYRVNEAPTITLTSPSEEGSSDDFATTILGNPWDMTSMSDIDRTANITSPQISTVAAHTLNDEPLGNITVFSGVSQPAPAGRLDGDPIVYFMAPEVRGYSNRIDPNRYRILTTEMGIPNLPRNFNLGSHARAIWQVAGETFENVSQDLVLNHRAGVNNLFRFTVDLKTLELETGGSVSTTGWNAGSSANPGISGLRIDPLEFPGATPFYFKRVKLAALERVGPTAYTIGWNTNKTSGTVNLSYDSDQDPSAGLIPIDTVAVTGTTGSYAWTVPVGLPAGTQLYIYAQISDGINTAATYSRWPIIVDFNAPVTARLTANRTTLNFGVTNLTRKTPPQTVRVTATGAPAGQPCWTVRSDVGVVLVDGAASTATKCGSGTFTVSLLDTNYVATGEGFATLTITSAGAVNTPQFVRAAFRISNSSTRPAGFIDTPVNNSTRSGSVGFTGWAVDDIGVSRVTLCRLAATGETAPGDPRCGGLAEFYVGDAVSLDDSRRDVEDAFPTMPTNYRGGWGFLVLTNMLPSQGNGTFFFNVRAFDVEGGFTLLGTNPSLPATIPSLTLNVNNASAFAPFGAIDTPEQGQVISGTAFVNFGWVLATPGKNIPGSSSITVYIDGVSLGNPTYGAPRTEDVERLFPCPTYQNSCAPGPSGFKYIDTTTLANGVHTIEWGVRDSAGVPNGIGSRFFTVFNTGAALTAGGMAGLNPGKDFGRSVTELSGISARTGGVRVRRGLSAIAPLRAVERGLRDTAIWQSELDRVEVHLADRDRGADRYDGYLVRGGRLMELPVGSSMDRARGVFAWQPGPGYIGEYELLFIKTDANGRSERIPVRMVLEPRKSQRLARSQPLSPLFRGVFESAPE